MLPLPVSEFIHIIEHFTVYCDVGFLVEHARAGLVHDFGFLGIEDGEAEVVACPREPVSSSLHCLLTGRIESTVISEKETFDDCVFHLCYC